MNLLLKNVLINDPASAHNGQQKDVLIRQGVIEAIGSGLETDATSETIEAAGMVVSPGWFDMRVNFGEPGEEQKCTIRQGQQAAADAGFTGVLLMPSTVPALNTGADISFVKSKASGHFVQVFPAGTLTDSREGKEMAGMYDMLLSGAVAFTDHKRALQNSGLMLRVLQYAANIGARVIAYADDAGLTSGLQANESPVTTMLGMKGMPAIAEAIAITRDLQLVEYSGLPLHISGVSTQAAVEAIRDAKAKGLPVTCEAYIYHLLLDDSCLNTFDSHYKVKPPLRSPEDVRAMQEAVIDGTIDVVCSDHQPEDTESKALEFDYARFGMLGMETFYSLWREAFADRINHQRMYEVLVKNPRSILGLPVPFLKEGVTADFTLYDPACVWTLLTEGIHSTAKNTPFLNRQLTGKVIRSGRG